MSASGNNDLYHNDITGNITCNIAIFFFIIRNLFHSPNRQVEGKVLVSLLITEERCIIEFIEVIRA